MFEYEIKKIQKYTNFHNPMDSFTTNLTKSLFTIIDIFNSFLQIYKYFPKKMREKLASDSAIQPFLFRAYAVYANDMTERWKFDEKNRRMHAKNLKKVHIIMVKYFI